MIFVILSAFFKKINKKALYYRAFSTKINDFRYTIGIFQENRRNPLYYRAFSAKINDFRYTIGIFQEHR